MPGWNVAGVRPGRTGILANQARLGEKSIEATTARPESFLSATPGGHGALLQQISDAPRTLRRPHAPAGRRRSARGNTDSGHSRTTDDGVVERGTQCVAIDGVIRPPDPPVEQGRFLARLEAPPFVLIGDGASRTAGPVSPFELAHHSVDLTLDRRIDGVQRACKRGLPDVATGEDPRTGRVDDPPRLEPRGFLREPVPERHELAGRPHGVAVYARLAAHLLALDFRSPHVDELFPSCHPLRPPQFGHRPAGVRPVASERQVLSDEDNRVASRLHSEVERGRRDRAPRPQQAARHPALFQPGPRLVVRHSEDVNPVREAGECRRVDAPLGDEPRSHTASEAPEMAGIEWLWIDTHREPGMDASSQEGTKRGVNRDQERAMSERREHRQARVERGARRGDDGRDTGEPSEQVRYVGRRANHRQVCQGVQKVAAGETPSGLGILASSENALRHDVASEGLAARRILSCDRMANHERIDRRIAEDSPGVRCAGVVGTPQQAEAARRDEAREIAPREQRPNAPGLRLDGEDRRCRIPPLDHVDHVAETDADQHERRRRGSVPQRQGELPLGLQDRIPSAVDRHAAARRRRQPDGGPGLAGSQRHAGAAVRDVGNPTRRGRQCHEIRSKEVSHSRALHQVPGPTAIAGPACGLGVAVWPVLPSTRRHLDNEAVLEQPLHGEHHLAGGGVHAPNQQAEGRLRGHRVEDGLEEGGTQNRCRLVVGGLIESRIRRANAGLHRQPM